MTTSEQRPVAEGLFELSPEGAAALLGSRCGGCSTYYFPKSLSCRNPQCEAKGVEDALLARRGTLYSYTVQNYRPPRLFGMEPWEPYAIGLVDVPEGLRVMGMLTGCDPEELQIGMPMQLVARVLYTDASGCEVLTYNFAPLIEEGAS